MEIQEVVINSIRIKNPEFYEESIDFLNNNDGSAGDCPENEFAYKDGDPCDNMSCAECRRTDASSWELNK